MLWIPDSLWYWTLSNPTSNYTYASWQLNRNFQPVEYNYNKSPCELLMQCEVAAKNTNKNNWHCGHKLLDTIHKSTREIDQSNSILQQPGGMYK